MAKGKELVTTISIAGKVNPSLNAAFARAGMAANRLGSTLKTLERTAALAIAGITAAAGALAYKLGSECVRAAMDFEKSMSNVATLLDGDVKGRIGELNEEIYQLSKSTGVSTADLSDGLYNVISALGDSADSMKILGIASKAAAAGGATTTDAINLLSAEMKGYNNTSGEFAQKCADMAFTVVKLGQTTFPELAANMGRVVPLANTMGMSIEEVNGYFATLTGVTGGAAEVSTQLQAALSAMLKPSKEMGESLKKLGYENGVAAIKAEGLQNILLKLRKNSKDALEFGNLFGRKEGINFALSVTGAQAETAGKKIAAMYQTAGAADAAFATSEDNLAKRLSAFRNYVEVAKIQIGQELIPVLTQLFDCATPHLQNAIERVIAKCKTLAVDARAAIAAFDWAGASAKARQFAAAVLRAVVWVREHREQLVSMAAAAAKVYASIKALQAVVFVFGLLKSAAVGCEVAILATRAACIKLGALASSLRGLVAAFTALRAGTIAATAAQWAYNVAAMANPVGLVILAIVALIAAIWLCYEYWDEICEFMGRAWDGIVAGLRAAGQWLDDTFPGTMAVVRQVWDDTCKAAVVAWDYACKAWEVAVTAVKAAWDLLQAAFYLGITAVCNGIQKAVLLWETMKIAAATLIDTLEKRFPVFFAGMRTALDAFKTAWQSTCDFLRTAFVVAWEGIKAGVSDILDGMLEKVRPIVDQVRRMADMASTIKNTVKGRASGAIESLKGMAGFAKGGFTHGTAICGEAGTEAVISFDPAYRAQNQGYLMTAAQMLGMTAAPVTNSSTSYNLGGVNFSPVIRVGDGASGGDIMAQLRARMPEFADAIIEELKRREGISYA